MPVSDIGCFGQCWGTQIRFQTGKYLKSILGLNKMYTYYIENKP